MISMKTFAEPEDEITDDTRDAANNTMTTATVVETATIQTNFDTPETANHNDVDRLEAIKAERPRPPTESDPFYQRQQQTNRGN